MIILTAVLSLLVYLNVPHSIALHPLYVYFVSFISTSFLLACLSLSCDLLLESELKCQFSEAFPEHTAKQN